MVLAQDILSRIVNVQWPGGLIMVMWVNGLKFGAPGNPSPPDPNLEILFKSSLNWFGFGNGKSFKSSSLTEKTRGTGQKVLFDTNPGRMEDYAYFEERDSETSTQTFLVLDQGKYGLLNQHSGEFIVSCFNPFTGRSIPFYVSFNGYPLFDPTGNDPSYASPPTDMMLIGDGISIDCGLGGIGWHPQLMQALVTHEETSSFTNKIFSGSRFLFINLSKLIGEVDDLDEFTIDAHVQFVPGIESSAKQTYFAQAMLGIYQKAEQDERPPPPGPPNPPGWPVVTDNPIQTNESLEGYFNGGPGFLPPNFDTDVERIPIAESAFALEEINTGETQRPGGKIRFTVNLTGEEPAISSEVIFDFED